MELTMHRIKWFLPLIGLLGLIYPVFAISERPTFDETECWFEVFGDYEIDCGYVKVPESRNADLADDTNEIEIAVARVRSLSNNPEPDPVIYLDGGPGGYSLISGDYYTVAFEDLLQDRDVILFDQRGVGFSEPNLQCSELTDLLMEAMGETFTQEEADELTAQAYEDCRDRLQDDGANFLAYNSAESASDIRDILIALDYDQVNLLGVSYGTRLALTMMRDYPDWVRSSVLDAVYPPNALGQADIITNAQRAFETIFVACENDELCEERYPDLRNVFWDMIAELNDDPEIVPYFDFITEQDIEVEVDGAMILDGLFSLMYDSSQISSLPRYIYEASRGNYNAFIDTTLFDIANNSVFSDGMYFSVQCYEEHNFLTEDDIDDANDTVNSALADAWLQDSLDTLSFCQEWTNNERAEDIESQVVVSDIPTLLTSGEYDPITPPNNSLVAEEGLSNFYSLVFPSTGHSAYFNVGSCATDIVADFINDPDREPDSSCIDDIPAPLFARPLITEVELEDYENETLGVSGIAPVGWEEDEEGRLTPFIQEALPAFVYRVPESLDEYIERIFFGDVYRLTEAPEPVDTIRENGVRWEIYLLESTDGFVYSAFAMAEIDGQAYVIALATTAEEERDALYDSLFLPALEAFEVMN
jgi:pimeloyl-ACP methyl ester carboxylesterase